MENQSYQQEFTRKKQKDKDWKKNSMKNNTLEEINDKKCRVDISKSFLWYCLHLQTSPQNWTIERLFIIDFK